MAKRLKPVPKPVSRKDKLDTITHLHDEVSFHTDHFVKHGLSAKEHIAKLDKHLKDNPELLKSQKSLHARVRQVHRQLKMATKGKYVE